MGWPMRSSSGCGRRWSGPAISTWRSAWARRRRGWRPVGALGRRAPEAGALDGDGRAELAGAPAGEALVWAWRDGALVERARVAFEGRPAGLRPRADLATVRIEAGALLAHASPFADGV